MAIPARAVFDVNVPSSGDGFISANFRNNYQSLWMLDMLPMRPRAHGSQASLADTGIMVLGTDNAGYHQHVMISSNMITLASGDITGFTPFPTGNPRVDIVYMSGDGTIRVTKGVEAASPASPKISGDIIPICHIYQKTTATKIVNYEDKDTSSSDSYIIRDIRPMFAPYASTTAGGASSYTTSFVSGDLTANVLSISHALGKKYVACAVYDSGDKMIIPTQAYPTDTSTFKIDLTGFPVVGTWNIRVTG